MEVDERLKYWIGREEIRAAKDTSSLRDMRDAVIALKKELGAGAVFVALGPMEPRKDVCVWIDGTKRQALCLFTILVGTMAQNGISLEKMKHNFDIATKGASPTIWTP